MGIDSSTTATKVEVRDASTGALVASARHPHPPTEPPRSEQDPDAWWDALVAAVRATGCRDVAAISVAAQQHGLVAVDASGAVVRPAKLWNDTESAPDAAWLVEQLGGPEPWAVAMGSVPVAAFTITKLSWLHRSEPDAFDRMARVLLPHDWLTWRLTGRSVTDRGDASGTGYWSPAEERWRFDLLQLVDAGKDWDAAVPEVLAPAEGAGPLTTAASDALGLDGGSVVVGPGTGDNMAAALGLGIGPGDVVISIGTSGTVYSVAVRPAADPTGAVAGFADATGRYLPLVCTLNATKVTDTVSRLLGLDRDALEGLALSAPAGAGGVAVVPYFDGERTPNRPDATGSILGLQSTTTPAQLARAAYEGVVCGLLDALDALVTAGVDVGGRLFLVGGGARSAAYRRVVADLAQRPVIVPDVDETVAAGACVQAAAVLTGTPAQLISAHWNLGHGAAVFPELSSDAAAEVRARYSVASQT